MDPITLLILGVVGVAGLVYGGDVAWNSKKVKEFRYKRNQQKELEETDKQHTEDLEKALRLLVAHDIEGRENVSIDAVYRRASNSYRQLSDADYRYARDNYTRVMQEVRREHETSAKESENIHRQKQERLLRANREKEMFNAVRKATADAIRQMEEKPLDAFQRNIE